MPFVGVGYPVNADGPGETSAVPDPSPSSFENLEAARPGTVDARVESGDETFVPSHSRNRR